MTDLNRLAASLADTDRIRKSSGDPSLRKRADAAHRELQRQYSAVVNPAAQAAREARDARANVEAVLTGAEQGQPELLRKVDQIRRADPSMSEYDVMLKAMGDRDDQAKYLERVRGRPLPTGDDNDEDEDDRDDQDDLEDEQDEALEAAGEKMARQIQRKAEEIRKADASVSEWEALERARKASPGAQARYLERNR